MNYSMWYLNGSKIEILFCDELFKKMNHTERVIFIFHETVLKGQRIDLNFL